MNRNIPSRQKLGIIEENKMSENWSYQKKIKGVHINFHFQMKINLRRIQMIYKKMFLKVQPLHIKPVAKLVHFEDLSIQTIQ